MLVSEWIEHFKGLKDSAGQNNYVFRSELFRAFETLMKDPEIKKTYGVDFENFMYALAQSDKSIDVLYRQYHNW